MTNPIKIYGNSDSGNCWKVKWTADRLGVPNEWIEVDIFNGESRTPEFLALNPWGQVPTVVFPNGSVLTQSNAIIVHLAEGSPLLPDDPFRRAQVLEWLFWEQNSHETTIATRRALLSYRGKTVDDIDPAMLERGNACLAHMESRLSASLYLTGEELTLADIALVAYTRVAHEGGFDLASYPSVQAWVARMERELGLAQFSSAG
jgi:glutathione S-transferase